MSFKENLKKKIRIDRLTRQVSVTIGSPGSQRKVDRDTMRTLLEMSPFVQEKKRDLELYFRELDSERGEILVLDNELPLYRDTTIEDVTMRRSPMLGEMVKIRNIFKILNDKDILMCRGREALYYVKDRALELLDLRYGEEDIKALTDDGVEAFARVDYEDVLEILELFAEVLEYKPLPAEALVNDYVMYGARRERAEDTEIFGPIVMYNEKTNALKWIKGPVRVDDPIGRDIIPSVALGDEQPDIEDHKVFWALGEELSQKKGPTIH